LDHRITHYRNLLAEDEIIEKVFVDALSDSSDDQMSFNPEDLLKMISQLNVGSG
jgi:sialic acid synthase SpsE